MAFARHKREDGPHVVDEAHVEHAICFIENDSAEFRKVQDAALNEVFDAPWGSDDEIRIVTQALYLGADSGTTNDTDRKKAGALRKAPILFLYLKSKLARGNHDEDALLPIFHDLVEERDEESTGLTRAGVCDANDVAAEKYMWDRLVLNGSWSHISLFTDVVFDAGVDLKIHE